MNDQDLRDAVSRCPALWWSTESSTTPGIGVAFLSIVIPLKRLKVTEIVGTAFRDRLDMVYFPTVFGVSVAIVGKLHWLPAHIVAPHIRVITVDSLPFLPNGTDGS